MIILQYLEPSVETSTFDQQQVRERLRQACAILPVDALAVGWDLPPQLLHACAEEAARAGCQLYRWQPLLTDDGELAPHPSWQAIGLAGKPVPGYLHMPEFTFVCPHQPAARAAVLNRIHTLCRSGSYHGIFLDRMRFPSPAADPLTALACFCDACRAHAATQQIDLEQIQHLLAATARSPRQAADLATWLLEPASSAQTPAAQALRTLLDLRSATITTLIAEAAAICRAEGLAVGLDCFSPALTRMVGQDLTTLATYADWTKVMSYGHTLGPAGIPFELRDMAAWLTSTAGMSEHAALAHLGAATRMQLPATIAGLETSGITSADLATEIRHGRAAHARPLLFGIELVELPGITHLTTPQIIADLQAARHAGADGLVLSWDLWHITPERLALVRDTWFAATP